RSSLEQIEVDMHLFGGLAFAYQAKPEDNTNEWLPDSQRVRRVVRRVSSTFWFFREILRYGEDCTIVSPESVRSRLTDKIKSLCQQYNLEIRD
ncbi:MAG: WYL domain-containing protein, partial [Cyanobacteriota bacterium]